jgi:hypothetical protein
MKSQLKSYFKKAALMSAVVVASGLFNQTQAQVKHSHIVVAETASNIHFVGVEGEMLIFELKLKTLLPKGAMLVISDENNNVLFEDRTDSDTYSIRYKIVRNNASQINFEVSGRRFFLNQSFNVSSRTEEKIEVTKV